MAELFAKLRASYNSVADRYDDDRWRSDWGTYLKEAQDELLRELLVVGPGDRVLDVATGTGRAAFALAESGAQIVGVDQSEQMLAVAEARRAERELGQLEFRLGSATDLAFPDDHFDAVMAVRFLHLLPQPVQRTLIEEMVRVLKPGGRLVVEWNNHFDGFGFGIVKERAARRAGKRARGTILPHQVRRQLAGLQIDRRVGVTYPGAGRLWRISPALARTFGKPGRIPPLYYCTTLLLVRARKP
jgi:ubiquinone/menaquinone biosynthesis C-methylase UbiE